MTTTSERKALERETGYQSGVGRVWGFGRDGDRFVAESLEPNPDLRGLEAVRVWDEMSRTDDQVGSALRALRTPVTSAGWALTNTDDVDDNVVEFVRSNIGLPKAGESRGRREHEGIVFSEHLAQAFKAAIYGYACVDEETEALTRTGWKHHWELTTDDELLTLNPETGRSEWHRPERINRWEGTHKVRVLDGRSHSSVTTDDHNWITRAHDTGKLRFKKTAQLNQNDRILMAAKSDGLPTEKKYTDAFVKLVAWFYTEGHIRPGTGAAIYQSHGVNEPYVNEIREVLTEVFGPPCTDRTLGSVSNAYHGRPAWREIRRTDRDATEFSLSKDAARDLTDIAPGRVVPVSFICDLTEDQLHMFVETSVKADGWFVKKDGAMMLVQKNPKMLDAAEVAAALLGIATVRSTTGDKRRGSTYYTTRFKFTTETRPVHAAARSDNKRSKDTWETLEGLVWCPTVTHRTWYARRRGTQWFTGNCFEQVYAYNPDDGYLHLRKLAPRDQTTIEEIEVGEDGGLRAVRQAAPALSSSRGGIPQARRIPVESLVFYCVGRDGADWYGTSVLRQAYRPWFFKDRLERIGVQIVERNGMGVPVATVSNSADHGMVDEALANFRAGATAYAKFPEGVDFKLVGVSGSTVDPLPQIKHYSQQISKALAQGFQDLGHDAGARSLGETFLKVALRASQEIADLIADTFTEHVIRDLVELNFGEGTPYPVLSPGDIVANGDTDSAVLVDLADAGLITPDQGLEKHLRAQHGLPELDPTTTRTVQGETDAPPVLGLSERPDLDRLEALTERLASMRDARGHEQ